MSGHSKWSTIKHKKAASDAKKGKEFTRASNLISLAAKNGGDPSMNPALALAIDRAKNVNMPKANIERAIKKGTGEAGGATFDEVLYEGYGPSGVAILVEAATDNKNRTVSEVRSHFTKHGGSIGNPGSVAYLFDKKGRIIIGSQVEKSDDDIEIAIIDSGADDFEKEDESYVVYTQPNDLSIVKKALETEGLSLSEVELAYISKSVTPVSDSDKAQSILKLMEALEELDDVVAVHSNFDIPDDILKELS